MAVDWVGKWYKLNKEAGGNDLCSFGKVDVTTRKIQWYYPSHAENDGYGIFTGLLENEGCASKFIIESRPDRPGFIARLRILFKAYFSMKSRPVQWVKKSNAPSQLDFKDLHYFFLTPKESAEVEESISSKPYSINSYLIYQLNNFVLSKLVSTDDHGKILFPINMRAGLGRVKDRGNLTSCIYLPLTKQSSEVSIHQSIKMGLKAKLHWGNWWLANIGKIIGVYGMRMLSKSSRKKSFYVGTFSSMGKWVVTDNSGNVSNETWIFSAPGSLNYPICMGVMKYNDRLTVSLKIDKGIVPDSISVKQMMVDIENQLRSDFL